MSSIKKLVRVFMVDETKHGFMMDESTTTAATLVETIANKIHLKDFTHFAIFEVKGTEERCLTADDRPITISEKWTSSLKTSTEPATVEPRFVFKKKVFLRDEDENDHKDSVARHMLYIQALHNVIEGEYPCSAEDAITLAALQTQVQFGDHNPANHVAGFFGQNLKNFVPKPLMQLRTAKEWETKIFSKHQSHLGMNAENAKIEYLNIVKAWPYYGTTYFKACRTMSKSKTLPPKVIIGVNLDGIVLVNSKDKQQVYSSHLFTDLLSWSISPDTFSFEFGISNEISRYTFSTTQAVLINDLVQSYVDVLLQMIKNDIYNESSSPRE